MPISTLQIPLEDLRRPEWQPLHVGDGWRYATVGSVRFVDPCTIVCCSLLPRKIYLIRFNLDDGGSFKVLDCAETTYAGRPTETDLCDTDGGGRVVTSNCDGASMSLYHRVDDEIRHARDLITGLDGNFCHGARFCGPNVVVATTLRDPIGAHFFDVQTMKKLLYIETARPAKDICFTAVDRAALIVTTGTPSSEASKSPRTSEILSVAFDLSRGSYDVYKRQSYGAGQFDSIVAHEGILYVIDSGRGCVLMIDANTLQQVDQIDGLSFPHGIDINYGMMAIACYGTNSVYVRPLSA